MAPLFRLVSTLSIVCCARAAAQGAEETACAADAGRDPVALMQLKSKVQRGGGSRAGRASVPIPVGRSLISTNPAKSLEFILKYFNAREVQVPACTHQTLKSVEVDSGYGDTFTYTFVQDSKLSHGSLDSSALVAEVQVKMEAVLAGKEGLYNAWIDNHDGLNPSFNYTKALDDGLGMGIFGWTLTERVFGIVRFWIPESMFTFEIGFPKDVLDQYNVPELIADDCRDDAPMPWPQDIRPVAWLKTTMMAAKPWVAGQWAENVLGVTARPVPFPWPPVEGCTEAIWKVYPETGWEMHFVLSSEFQSSKVLKTDGGLVQAFVDEVYTFRNLTAGVFDHFMHNNLIMRVESLDPFVRRLEAVSLPFLLTRVGAEYALFMDVPQNAQIVQLRSAHVSVAEPKALEGVCLV